ncbi:MBL fold metallo-hydrolase [Anaerolineales bacterium]
MHVQFFGAARDVTGSKHLLTVNGKKILLDCGLYQGRRADTYEKNHKFHFSPQEIDILILSHAHIDHSGNIPNLVKQGFRGDIICTAATRSLCATMLLDSGHIQEKDAEYVSKVRRKHHQDPVEPIYTKLDAMEAMRYFSTRPYDVLTPIAEGISLRFLEAGHMLGSAIVELEIDDKETGKSYKLVFSGDLGRVGIPIIRDPKTIHACDYLIMESTYGNRLHESYPDAELELKRIVLETYERGGLIIMPAFAVGRTQQMVYSLHRLMVEGDIPSIPVYVDSPLAVDATSIFRLHPEAYDQETYDFLSESGARDPFGFDMLTYVRKVEDSIALNDLDSPAVIISASGMLEFGRIVHHLKYRIGGRKNTVLITGFQAEHTLGRKLIEGVDPVKIFGEEYKVNAHIEVINGFSGHADRDELLAWVHAMEKKPKKIFLVHGEIDAQLALKESLESAYNIKVEIPVLDEKFEIGN